MDEVKIIQPPFHEAESGHLEKSIRRRQMRSRQTGGEKEKRVQHRQDQPSAPGAPTALGHPKIREQPVRSIVGARSDFWNEEREFLGLEAVEEKVGRDEVKL